MNRLKQLRIEKGLLQSDIAKIINKTDRAVGQYEREERDPSSETWSILANFFGVSLDYLLGKTDIKNYNKDEQDFRFAYHKEMEGLTEEEIADALRFYKEMKKKINKDKKEN
ncbi:MAG: helix-turn-helix transcriptional regulator [Clostridia bacterium]|nr:helix-turn-helix transcriptional regulator [Clostridia bacterium]